MTPYEIRYGCLQQAERIVLKNTGNIYLPDIVAVAKELEEFINGSPQIQKSKNIDKSITELPKTFMEFAEECTILHFNHGKIKFEPFKYQRHLIDIVSDPNYNLEIINSGSNLGTTLGMTIWLLFKALTENNFTILIGSSKDTFKLNQNILKIFERIKKYYGVNISEHNRRNIIFSNNSKIIFSSISEHMNRGLNMDLIWLDDLSNVKSNIFKTTYNDSLKPALASGGKLVITHSRNLTTIRDAIDIDHYFYELFEDITYVALKDNAKCRSHALTYAEWHVADYDINELIEQIGLQEYVRCYEITKSKEIFEKYNCVGTANELEENRKDNE